MRRLNNFGPQKCVDNWRGLTWFFLGGSYTHAMLAILKTNNPVTLSFARAVLADAEIEFFMADSHMSIMEGSIGILPQRLMVIDEDEADARAALTAAGLAHELQPENA